MRWSTIVVAAVLAISMAGPPTIAQGPGSDPSQARLLQGFNQLETEDVDPRIDIALYLGVSYLQQPDLSTADLEAASAALTAFQQVINLTETPPPSSFQEVPSLLERYSSVQSSVAAIGDSPGADEHVWATVQRLLDGALDRWGASVGDDVFQLARQEGSDQNVAEQLDGYRQAAAIFEAADAGARATAAKMQADTLETRFEEEIGRADDVREEVESLASSPPSAANLFGAILWYQQASEAREDATTAASIYDNYGRDDAQSSLETASASLASAQDSVRSGLIAVLVPVHLAIGLLAGGVVALVQRYERDVREVMLGTELALFRRVAE